MKPLLLLSFAFTASFASAEIFQWQDDQGRTHFGDRRPHSSITVKKVELPITNVESGQALQDWRDDRHQQLQSLDQQRQIERNQHAQDSQRQARRQQQCKNLRDQLRAAQEAGYVFRYNEQGEKVVFADQERDDYQANLSRQLQYYCGK